MSTCKDCLHVENCEIAKMTYGHYATDYDCDLYEERDKFVESSESENESLNYIREKLSDKARLLQLGEECAELSAAIFKLFRKKETDNPTPKSLEEIYENLIEEIEDVAVSISVISEYLRDKKVYEAKLKRWVERLKERENNG